MEFRGSCASSVGIEIECHLLDPETLDLVDGIRPLLEGLADHPAIKPEFNQSTVEIVSKPGDSVEALSADISAVLAVLQARCRDVGLVLCGSGTHPFCSRLATVTPLPRYLAQHARGGYLAKQLMTCALHVHVGMSSGDEAIAMMTAIRPYLPVLLALSASSPFWRGYDTGYASYRQRILAGMRSYGLPPMFGSWREFAELFHSGRAAGMFEIIRDVHWDLRPQPDLGTLEVRVMDSQPTIGEALALTALVHCLIVHHQQCHRQGTSAPLLTPCHAWFERENYFQASLLGLDASFVEDNGRKCRSIRAIVREILDFLEPTADRLGETAWLRPLKKSLEEGSSYIRQRRVFQQTGSEKQVAASLVGELEEDFSRWAIPGRVSASPRTSR